MLQYCRKCKQPTEITEYSGNEAEYAEWIDACFECRAGLSTYSSEADPCKHLWVPMLSDIPHTSRQSCLNCNVDVYHWQDGEGGG